MLKRVIYGLVLVGVVALCYVGYANWRQRRAMMSGEVTGGPPEAGDSAATGTSVSPAEDGTKSTLHVGSPAPGEARSAFSAMALAGVPATDSMVPNPPNGMAYAGTGHFQVYRQGNLTYRIDTETGQTCVLYATNEEWRKPQVYSHGCGSSGAR